MAHFGLIDEFDIIGALGAVELASGPADFVVPPSAGVRVTEALSVFRKSMSLEAF